MNDFNETLSENDVRKMVGSILRRAQLCLDSDGDSFEHLLKKKKSIQETGDSRSNGSIDSSSSSEDSEEDDEESEDESEEESEITSSIEIAGHSEFSVNWKSNNS